MVNITENQIRDIGKVLCDINRPLKERFRALFTLRNIGGLTSIECISNCFNDDSALLKHELAYCLGQMRDEAATEVLIKVLKDTGQEPIVRHEAAEALGAIGTPKLISLLNEFLNDPVVEVAETCELAINRIKWFENNVINNSSVNPYNSVDPAPPTNVTDIEKLQDILLNQTSLFESYRAMFALRNLKSKEAVKTLASGLKYRGALFRHEIAFVLGQLQDESSVPYLIECLEDSSENEMVRHECAEALGAIATKECYDVLKKYLLDEKRVVKESCEIALDMCEYENSPEFQYANAVEKIND